MTAEFKLEGLGLFNEHGVGEVWGEMNTMMNELSRLNSGHGDRNVFIRLRKYRENTQRLIKYVEDYQVIVRAALDRQDQMLGKVGERNRKKWTPTEDRALVDQACEPGSTLVTLALSMNRTPGAVASRLTHLVGIKKVSREIAGRIIGSLDGEPVEGYFEGVLLAEEGDASTE